MKRSLKPFAATLLLLLWAGGACADSTRDAWAELRGERFEKNPGFVLPDNDPALPNVLIYGDSISIGYTQRVRENLKGEANVYRLYCNGGDSSSFIDKMSRMHSVMRDPKLDKPWTFQWDVVHFNVGLHDLKHVSEGRLDKKNGKQVSLIDTYKENLNKIIAYLQKLSPDAQLIFATTTPVPEGEPGRIAGDAAKYNAAALEVLRSHPEIAINDLYAFTKPNQARWWVEPGNVHYNGAGQKAQGDEVARIIREALDKKGEAQ